jgi:hypothetical protein
MKRKLYAATEHSSALQKRLHNASRRESRAKKSCQTMAEELDACTLVNDELRLKLDAYSSE